MPPRYHFLESAACIQRLADIPLKCVPKETKHIKERALACTVGTNHDHKIWYVPKMDVLESFVVFDPD